MLPVVMSVHIVIVSSFPKIPLNATLQVSEYFPYSNGSCFNPILSAYDYFCSLSAVVYI